MDGSSMHIPYPSCRVGEQDRLLCSVPSSATLHFYRSLIFLAPDWWKLGDSLFPSYERCVRQVSGCRSLSWNHGVKCTSPICGRARCGGVPELKGGDAGTVYIDRLICVNSGIIPLRGPSMTFPMPRHSSCSRSRYRSRQVVHVLLPTQVKNIWSRPPVFVNVS